MKTGYEADYWIRRMMHRLGWSLALLMLFGMLLTLAWAIAAASERRAMQATRENLADSLSALTAERVAKNQALEPAWQSKNPFTLLRWRQDDYCGELAASDEPRAGCWYWLPGQAWVLYRARFAGGWRGKGSGVRVWRLSAIPDKMPTASRLAPGFFALELIEVPAAELSAQGF